MHCKRLARMGLVGAALGTGVLWAGAARADVDEDRTTTAAPMRPRFIADLRAIVLARTDNNYFGHANTYAYSIDPGAGGIELNVGAEVVRRVALLGSAHYTIDGADRDSGRLRLQSGALLGLVRWTFVRTGEEAVHFDAAVQGGFGRYAIKETYIDPAISPQSYDKDDGSWGGVAGVQASVTLSGFVAVAGYSFHYAPATISDNIGGTVQAGGHELSIGVGVWL